MTCQILRINKCLMIKEFKLKNYMNPYTHSMELKLGYFFNFQLHHLKYFPGNNNLILILVINS